MYNVKIYIIYLKILLHYILHVYSIFQLNDCILHHRVTIQSNKFEHQNSHQQ